VEKQTSKVKIGMRNLRFSVKVIHNFLMLASKVFSIIAYYGFAIECDCEPFLE
jgi:hypothetical protein